MSISPTQAQEFGDRQPYAAGRFYEKDPEKLRDNLARLFNKPAKTIEATILALISPHAGFAYSGEVAATGYAQLDKQSSFENIFIIGSSHTTHINGASVYAGGNYLTPLGTVEVNGKLAKQLIEENPYISFMPSAHTSEHIIENQLPLLQYHLEKPITIVPIVIGTDDENILQSLAQTLSPYLNDRNLFVISADFSHYPNYADACRADSATALAITKNDPSEFQKILRDNKKQKYSGMVTSTCGSTAIRMLLHITKERKDLEYIPLKYMNSGDASFGDKARVVGYFSMVLAKSSHGTAAFRLSREDKEDLLNTARLTLEEYINNQAIPSLDSEQFSKNLNQVSGVFVSLYRDGELRGCVGQFNADKPLYQMVQEMTIAAAIRDQRFRPVRPEELDLLQIEISVLTPLEKIDSVSEIDLGEDGIYIVKGKQSGTYLPEVATKTGWTLEEFLGRCARDKAGIGWEGWKDADIYTYQAIVFSENR